MKKNQLSIRFKDKHIGTLEQTLDGKLTFSYDIHAKHAISIAMPIRQEPYGELSCQAYFGGLLPESEVTKKIIAKKYGISPHNNFALLKAIGYDCAGAISCHATKEVINEQTTDALNGRIISDHELYQHLSALPQKPLFMEVDGLRLSLAGVQDKAAVCLIDQQIALAEQGCPTTHILKPASLHFDGMAENEYFCLRLAKKIGLPVPQIELRHINDISFLLIERYDRRIKDFTIERIHQEDFCQALKIVSLKKYQNEGGPGFKDCFTLLNTTAQPAVDRNLLASALVFNYLIGNMDAHGKNFSLLHHAQDNIRLAPFYDILCTRVYPDLSTKMAMKIGSKFHTDQLTSEHWQQLCLDNNYSFSAMKKLITHCGECILKFATEERELLMATAANITIIDKILNVTKSTIQRTLKQLKLE